VTLSFPSGGIDVYALAATYGGYQSIQAAGSINAGTGYGFYVGSTQVINGSGEFIGAGVGCPGYPVTASGFLAYVSGSYYTGQSWQISISGSNFVIKTYPGGATVGSYATIAFAGGLLAGV
jgi:hypothetical protein